MLAYKIATDIKIVKGVIRSCIYDFIRKDYFFVENEFINFLKKIDGLSANNEFDFNENEKKFLSFALSNEFILIVPNNVLNFFPKIKNKVKFSNLIQTIYLKVTDEIQNELLLNLGLLNAKHLVVISDNYNSLLNILQKHFAYSSFYSIEILVNYKISELQEMDIHKNEKVIKINNFDNSFYNQEAIFIPSFHIDNRLFFEAKKYNLFFNRTLFISTCGRIYSDYYFRELLFKLESFTLPDLKFKLLYNSTYNKYAKVHKKKVNICCSCEFRYMCIDSRIPILNGESYTFESSCGYNPNTGEWNELSEKILKQNSTNLTSNQERINKINIQLEKSEEISTLKVN